LTKELSVTKDYVVVVLTIECVISTATNDDVNPRTAIDCVVAIKAKYAIIASQPKNLIAK
jgi:hypothetical protein